MRHNLRCGIHCRGGVPPPAAQRVGEPNPYVFRVPGFLRPLRPCVKFPCRPPCNPLIRIIRDSDKEHLSPLWGFKTFVYRVFYKHAAPLGLNAAMHQNSRWDIQRRGEVSKPDGLGNPTPTNSMVGWCLCFLSVQSAESVLCHIRDSDAADAINMSPRWG